MKEDDDDEIYNLANTPTPSLPKTTMCQLKQGPSSGKTTQKHI